MGINHNFKVGSYIYIDEQKHLDKYPDKNIPPYNVGVVVFLSPDSQDFWVDVVGSRGYRSKNIKVFWSSCVRTGIIIQEINKETYDILSGLVV